MGLSCEELQLKISYRILSYIDFVLVISSRTVVVSSSSYQSNLYASNVLKFSVDHVISVLSALYFIAAGIDA